MQLKPRIFHGGWIVLTGGLAVWLAACAGGPPGNLGVTDGRLAPCPSSPNCVSSFAADSRHKITPLAFSGAPQAAFDRLKKVLADRSDTKIIEEKPGYLRVAFHTLLFVDDGEFLLGKDHIDVRSASRLGYSDLGKNRKRMESIRKAFEQLENSSAQ